MWLKIRHVHFFNSLTIEIAEALIALDRQTWSVEICHKQNLGLNIEGYLLGNPSFVWQNFEN